MRVFVGFGYNERDAWIDRLVFPLIHALGCEPVHAKVTFGSSLTANVKETMLSCAAMVGFLTRREQVSPQQWGTHWWVLQELGVAYSTDMPTVEVREEGVGDQTGMGQGYRHIQFTEANKDQCLVELAVAIAVIRDRLSVRRVRLGPQAVAANIREKMQPDDKCVYRIRRQNSTIDSEGAEIIRIQGALYVDIPGLRRDDLVEMRIKLGDHVWQSDYEAVDAVEISLSVGN